MNSGVKKQLNQLLELIEQNIDVEHCKNVDKCYRQCLSYEEVESPPLIMSTEFGHAWKLLAPWNKFQTYGYYESFHNPAKMMQNQLLDRVVPGVLLKDDSPLMIRNNHGTIQIASAMGVPWEMHEEDYPWVKHCDSSDAIRKLLDDNAKNDLTRGVVPQSTETLAFYGEQLSRYPRCREAIQIALPDLQGPFDTANEIWGSDIMYAICDGSELFTELMDRTVDTMLAAYKHYHQFTVNRLHPGASVQHGYVIPGSILIRNDSSILVSGEMYANFVAPYDGRLLTEVGGGSLHFCGNGQHLVDAMLDVPGVLGLDFGQPDIMDIKTIYEKCRQRCVAVTNLFPSREDIVNGTAKQDYPSGAIFVCQIRHIDDACEILKAYKQPKQ